MPYLATIMPDWGLHWTGRILIAWLILNLIFVLLLVKGRKPDA